MTARLVRQILLGASTAGLEIAGAAALGPAWPILRGALGPVLDRLRHKLGGEDPVGSPEAAQRAAAAFEDDPRLEELLRSNLEQALQPVLAGQQHLEAGLQTLCQLVLDNSQALAEIQRSVGSIDEQLEAGVTLSDETVERIAEAAAVRTSVTLDVHTFARDEAEAARGAVAEDEGWMTRDDLVTGVNQAVVVAVEQLEDGRVIDAVETLTRARATLAEALSETPSDIQLRLLQGYVLKTTAQAGVRAGDHQAAERSLERAETMFRLILKDIPADPGVQGEIASAINGLGNLVAARGNHADAASLYRQAVDLAPGYAYAWHDYFASLVALAGDGDLRPDELDLAWRNLLETAPGHAGLEPARLEALRAYYESLRPHAERG